MAFFNMVYPSMAMGWKGSLWFQARSGLDRGACFQRVFRHRKRILGIMLRFFGKKPGKKKNQRQFEAGPIV
jgi:hypothetical protein